MLENGKFGKNIIVYFWSYKKLRLIRSFNNSRYCGFNLALLASVKTVMRSPAVTANISDSILLIAKIMRK